MMFVPKTNASRYDLDDRMDWYIDALEVLGVHRCAHRFSEPYLVSVIKHYWSFCAEKKVAPSKEFFLKCIDAYGDRGMSTKSRIIAMLESREPLAFEKPARVNERPFEKRDSHLPRSTSPIQGLVETVVPLPSPDVTGILPDCFFTKATAQEWIKKNHPRATSDIETYFIYTGYSPGNGEIYILKEQL